MELRLERRWKGSTCERPVMRSKRGGGSLLFREKREAVVFGRLPPDMIEYVSGVWGWSLEDK